MTPGFLVGRRFPWIVLAVGVLALTVRLVYLHQIQASPLFDFPVVDAKTYVDDARHLSSESWLGRPTPFWQPPLYPYALALLFRVFGESYYLPRLFQAILGAGVCVLTMLIGRRVFPPAVTLVAGLAAALYGPLIYFGGELLPTLPAIFLDLLLLLLLLRAPGTGRWSWLAAGLLLGLSCLAVANVLLLVPFLLFWRWRCRGQEGIPLSRIAQQGGLLLAGCLLTIAPVALRNWQVGGDLVLISHNAGINFYIGNNPEYDRTVEIRPGRDWAQLVEMPEREAGIERPSAKSRFFFARSWEFIAAQPRSYLRLLLRKLYLYWRGDEIRRNLDPYYARRDSSLLAILLWKRELAFPFGLVAPFALIGLVAFCRSPAGRGAPGRLLLLFPLAYMASVVLFFVTSRYRLPGVPVLLLFAAYGAQICLAPPRRLKMALAALLLLVANAGSGRMDEAGEPQQHFWLGWAYEQKGMSANAVREYRIALDGQPDHETALLRLAALYSGHDEAYKAIEIYLRYLQFYPESERARFLLANTYLQVQQYGKAIAVYEELAPRLPDWAELHGRLGYAQLMAGHPDGAIAAYRRTLELNPDSTLVRYQLAHVYEAEGLLEAAVDETCRLLQHEPDQAAYLVYLADLLIAQEERGRESIILGQTPHTREAEAHLRRAIDLDPDSPLAYWSLGLLLARQSRYLEATPSFEAIVRLAPLDAQVHACLGNLYERIGRKELAEQHFARYARLAQEDRFQDTMRSALPEQMGKIQRMLKMLGK
jgi:tetratricopeptide (TPR) repeat protein